jgi:uncharacterized membrane protein YjjP (DUF1212 family)
MTPNRRELDRDRATARARRRWVLVRDAVLAIIVALMLFGAWKVLALAFVLGPP